VFNDEDLGRFTNWIVVQPEYEDSGFVGSANDHGSKTKTVLWAGPATALLARIVNEAEVRGIGLVMRNVQYSRADLQRGITAIFAAEASLLEAGFHLSGVACIDLSHDGLIVELDERLVADVRVVLSQIPGLCSAIDLADVQIADGKWFLL
jgi:hypothetical protein